MWFCLFLAVLGLPCWTVEISLVEVRGGASSLKRARFSLRGFPGCGAQALGCVSFSSCGSLGSAAQAPQLWQMGLVAPQPAGSSQIRGRTCVS